MVCLLICLYRTENCCSVCSCHSFGLVSYTSSNVKNRNDGVKLKPYRKKKNTLQQRCTWGKIEFLCRNSGMYIWAGSVFGDFSIICDGCVLVLFSGSIGNRKATHEGTLKRKQFAYKITDKKKIQNSVNRTGRGRVHEEYAACVFSRLC